MKVLKRVLIKFIILVLVVGIFGGGAAAWQAYKQSTPQYAIENYLTKLIENKSDKAYQLLDQSEDAYISETDYSKALETKKYSLYSEYNLFEMEKRRDNDGQEYIDYRIEFLDAAQSVQLSEDFTVKKQAEPIFGIFDEWKVLSGHCMVKDFLLTVPTGSEVYLDSVQADTAWIVRDGVPMSYDCYKIPSLLPGSVSLVVRHPAFESVDTSFEADAGSADYSSAVTMKVSAQDEMKELAVKALKAVYTAAVTEKMDDLEASFASCKKEAEKLVKNQAKEFSKENELFKSVAVSRFDGQFGDLVFTEEENGAITTEMRFSYHYDVKAELNVDTGEYYDDGSSIFETREEVFSGESQAVFGMAYYDGSWHIDSVKMEMIPKN